MESVGLLLALGMLAVYLLATYSVKSFSDPGQWYAFGMSFPEAFGREKLAYGFPLALWLAARVVGPLRAFLLNIPVLVLLAGLFYAFAKAHAADGRERHCGEAVTSGALALLIFLWLDKDMLRYLANPYRDPLSFVFVLLACLSLAAHLRRPLRSPWSVALAGACVGLASSVRETSVLMLIPLLLYALAEKARDRSLPLWRPMFIFGLALAVSGVPLAVQNRLAGGSAVVPAQASAALKDGGVAGLGLGSAHLHRVLPDTLAFFYGHYGPCLLIALAAGVWLAWRRRNLLALALSLPAGLVYLALYASYTKVVLRYLLIVDLFTIPVMASGMAGLLWHVARRVRSAPVRARLWILAGGGAFLLAAALLANGVAAKPEDRLRLHHVGRLRDALNTALPPGAAVLAEGPFYRTLDCFTHARPKALCYLAKGRTLRDPDLPTALRTFVDARAPVYFMHNSDLYGQFMLREFDLELVRSFSSAEFGFRGLLLEDTFHLHAVVPWSSTSSVHDVTFPAPGRYILALDAGHLSKHERRGATVLFDDIVLDASPSDGLSYYGVEVRDASRAHAVRLASDGPVPGGLQVRFQPATRVIAMEFVEDSVVAHLQRLSPSFLTRLNRTHIGIASEGWVDVPTVDPHGAVFVMAATVGFPTSSEPDGRVLSIAASGRVLLERRVGEGWQNLSFVTGAGMATQRITRLEWTLRNLDDTQQDNYLMVQNVDVWRVEVGDVFEVRIGTADDRQAIVSGVHAPEGASGLSEARWRWTTGCARLRLVLQAARTPTALRIVYFDAHRPAALGPLPVPEFLVNGHQAAATLSTGESYGMRCVTADMVVPAEWMPDAVSLLEILTPAWVPLRDGVSADRRELGIMLHSVKAERAPE